MIRHLALMIALGLSQPSTAQGPTLERPWSKWSNGHWNRFDKALFDQIGLTPEQAKQLAFVQSYFNPIAMTLWPDRANKYITPRLYRLNVEYTADLRNFVLDTSQWQLWKVRVQLIRKKYPKEFIWGGETGAH